VAAIPAVTPYFCARELIAISPLPLFNIFEPLNRELAARAARRVAVFGTRFVMESALFGAVNEVEIIKARPDEADFIHDTYVALARTGKGAPEQRGKLTVLAHSLLRREGLDNFSLEGSRKYSVNASHGREESLSVQKKLPLRKAAGQGIYTRGDTPSPARRRGS
jgi:aspartate racemase